MVKIDLLKKIEGKQTIETISQLLDLKEQSVLNLISKLKREGYITVSGGNKQKRIYTISTTRQIPKLHPGMFEILNKYAPEKISPHFDHVPHYDYTVENAIIDLIRIDDIRILTNLLSLFNHVKDWKLLQELARKYHTRNRVGALYEIARTVTKTKKMPEKYKKMFLEDDTSYKNSSNEFPEIEKKYKTKIPFNKKDLEVYKND